MKNANFSRSFFAFLGMVLVGVVALLLFTEPPRATQAAGLGDAGAAMDGDSAAGEPPNAPPVVEAHLISDAELTATAAADVAEPATAEVTSTSAAAPVSASAPAAAGVKAAVQSKAM